MDSFRYLSFPGVCVSYVLNNLLSKSLTELLDVGIKGLVGFVQVNKYMEHLSINNKYLTFLGKWQNRVDVFNQSYFMVLSKHIVQDKEYIISVIRPMVYQQYRRGPAQDVIFFYTGSHLSELQSCTLTFLTDFYFIFIFKYGMTQFSH